MRVRQLVSIAAIASAALSACTSDSVGPPGQPASGDVSPQGAVKFWESGSSVYWNSVARDMVVKYKSSPFAALRGYALVSRAQYNAVAAVGEVNGGVRPSPTAAVAHASAVVLKYLFPAEQAFLDGLVAAQLSSPAARYTDIDAGEEIGSMIGQRVVADGQVDRFFASWTGTVPVGAGLWFSTATPAALPVGPMFGNAETYFLTSGDQFRPPPPPAFGSAEFAAALAEVRQISDTRTPEQTANAQYWAMPNGTITPPGFWNAEASRLAVSYHLNERRTAHVLALMNMAGFDALVACHDAKYAYWLLRPSQADPLITTAVGLPNFPSYPSNHACISGAQAMILAARFPAEKARLDALAEQAAGSRLDGGIHYRFDNEVGLRLGRDVAGLALSIDPER